MYTQLINHIQQYIALGDDSVCSFTDYMEPQSVKNKEYLIKEGQICRNYYFVKSGCLRMFYNSNKGVEQIVQFAIKDWWLTDYLSITNNQPSTYSI